MISYDDAISHHLNEVEGRDVEDGLEAVVLAIAALRFARDQAENDDTLEPENLIQCFAPGLWRRHR